MNNNSVLGKVVNELTRPQGKKQRKQKKQRASNRRSNNNGGSRGFPNRDPGSRAQPGPRDTALSLTRSQFTATSPLNLFEIRAGSTPGGVRMRGREMIESWTAPTALTGTFAILNPTPFNFSPASFPRLAAFVPTFEYYKFHKCCVVFQSNSPTTATGAVSMAIDYDPKDPAPTSFVGMMRNISSTMANIYSDASLELIGSLSRLPKFDTAQTTSPDAAQEYQGVLYVAVEGVTAASGAILGYSIAEYDIEFFTPQ